MKKTLFSIRWFRHWFILIFFVHSSVSYSRQVTIGLFPGTEMKALFFSVVSGNYKVLLNDTIELNASEGTLFFLQPAKNGFLLSDSVNSIGIFRKIYLKSTGDQNIFQFKPILPLMKSFDYDDDLVLVSENGNIKATNSVNIEKYIAGVIEAEGGSNALPEFYKAQGILVRTYLFRNVYRHASEGFILCNTTHCQAYKGRSMLNYEIYEAVKATEGLVLADSGNNPVMAAYHSNCGGMTITSDMVWQNHVECLQSIHDPFCENSRNYRWTKRIPLNQWNEYLKRNGIEIQTINYLQNTGVRQKT
ncbi:MAG: SpoIID/LytB domain-containing protein [Bacteroidales bacterium]|nr:SpoIID/LytB domain-containing protein [Bacteroidales bacterium]